MSNQRPLCFFFFFSTAAKTFICAVRPQRLSRSELIILFGRAAGEARRGLERFPDMLYIAVIGHCQPDDAYLALWPWCFHTQSAIVATFMDYMV